MHPTAHLQEIFTLLAAAVGVVACFRALKLSPVLGYLVAGAAIGPFGLGLIEQMKDSSAIAEFGVMFLLFLIGLELSFARLASMRAEVLELGGVQVFATGLLIGLIAWWMGEPVSAALIIGGGLALSSTAIVLQVLQETGERSSQVGRLSFAVLLLQDLAVVPLLVLVPLLSKAEASIPAALADAAGKAAVALALIFLLGRRLIKPLFRRIATLHNAELFNATTLLVVFGAAWATSSAGLSLALGAFIAGLLIAETEYHHQVAAEVTPFKGLFLGFFFMTVGMSVDLRLLIEQLGVILSLALALMVLKTTILYALLRAAQYGRTTALHTGLLLSQGGEFAFVLFALAAEGGLIDAATAQILLVMTTLSMALTPIAEALGRRLARAAAKRVSPIHGIEESTQDLENHVIIAGFGRMGQTIAKMLLAEGIAFIALDTDPKNVEHGRARGKPVYFGDATRLDVMHKIGAARAHSVVITLKGQTQIDRLLRDLHQAYPELPIVVSAKDMEHAAALEAAGASVAVPEVLESSLHLGAALLEKMGVTPHEVTRILSVCRAQHYAYVQPEGETPS